jgi:hypothetical protein
MAKTFKEIIADAQSYPDNTVFKIGDAEIQLGELRGLSASERQSVEQELMRASEQRKKADEQLQSAMQLATTAAELKARLEAAPTAAPSPDAYDTDPFYGPVRERMTKLERQYGDTIKKLQDQVELANKSLTNASVVWYKREAQREFDSYPFKDKEWFPKNKTTDEVIKYAAERRLLDSDGLPSVRMALDDMTREPREKEIETSKYEEGVRAGEQRAMASSLQRPTMGIVPPQPKDPPKDWKDLAQRAYSNPEIQKEVSNFIESGRI